MGRCPYIPVADSETCPGIMVIVNTHSTDQVISQVISVATGQVMELWVVSLSAVVLEAGSLSTVALEAGSHSVAVLEADSHSVVVLEADSHSVVVTTGCLFRTLAPGDIHLDTLYRLACRESRYSMIHRV